MSESKSNAGLDATAPTPLGGKASPTIEELKAIERERFFKTQSAGNSSLFQPVPRDEYVRQQQQRVLEQEAAYRKLQGG